MTTPVPADVRWMRRALALARRGWGRVSPNPLVGAVVVRDGRVVGEGWHAEFGRAHAEVMALGAAGAAARGATLYVTLEPCAHHGKTPPCTQAILAAGVARVVVAVPDPHAVASGGARALRAHGLEVAVGTCAPEARDLNAIFLHAIASDRPFVTLKLALSVDGAIADHAHGPGWLTGPAARRAVHAMRAQHDAVAVGMGTVRIDDPLLTVRQGRRPRVPPRRVVFSRDGALPEGSALARTARDVPVMVLAREPSPARVAALGALGVRCVPAASLAEGLRVLRTEGVHGLLVEGGAGLAGALLADGLVDRLVTITAPVILGAGALSPFAGVAPVRVAEASRWRVVARRALGADTLVEYAPAMAPGGA